MYLLGRRDGSEPFDDFAPRLRDGSDLFDDFALRWRDGSESFDDLRRRRRGDSTSSGLGSSRCGGDRSGVTTAAESGNSSPSQKRLSRRFVTANLRFSSAATSILIASK